MSKRFFAVFFLIVTCVFAFGEDGCATTVDSSIMTLSVGHDATPTDGAESPLASHFCDCVHHICCALVPKTAATFEYPILFQKPLFLQRFKNLSQVEPPFRPPIVC